MLCDIEHADSCPNTAYKRLTTAKTADTEIYVVASESFSFSDSTKSHLFVQRSSDRKDVDDARREAPTFEGIVSGSKRVRIDLGHRAAPTRGDILAHPNPGISTAEADDADGSNRASKIERHCEIGMRAPCILKARRQRRVYRPELATSSGEHATLSKPSQRRANSRSPSRRQSTNLLHDDEDDELSTIRRPPALTTTSCKQLGVLDLRSKDPVDESPHKRPTTHATTETRPQSRKREDRAGDDENKSDPSHPTTTTGTASTTPEPTSRWTMAATTRTVPRKPVAASSRSWVHEGCDEAATNRSASEGLRRLETLRNRCECMATV
ncbi:hypothetical protein D9611_011238 [Ephemerocybe angulata]|uniref:Uncharacterized protein n=1 Tax=Ephemerocybe angulata TaxID=980116 RepID=A0A8H5CCA4_9AGAR|nr:hypothetical protein D9611_011238 [Tulosesus angulatus]